VPCSTGEWVRGLDELGQPWTLVDRKQSIALRAARGLTWAVPITADLGNGLPIKNGSQDLLLCVHALYVLRDQAFQLRRFADRLKPGGALVLVTFDRDETVGDFARRVRQGHGVATMLSMLPWKTLDRLWTPTWATYLDGAALDAALSEAGLEITSCRAVFAGTSTLRVARRPV
jgi:SAM-dependent methyltransferase